MSTVNWERTLLRNHHAFVGVRFRLAGAGHRGVPSVQVDVPVTRIADLHAVNLFHGFKQARISQRSVGWRVAFLFRSC